MMTKYFTFIIFNFKSLLKLIELSEGDLRKSINVLQSTGMLYDRKVDETSVVEISGVRLSSIVEDLGCSRQRNQKRFCHLEKWKYRQID